MQCCTSTAWWRGCWFVCGFRFGLGVGGVHTGTFLGVKSRVALLIMLARLAMLVAYDGTDYRGWTDVRDSVLRPTVAKVLRCDVAQPPLIEAASRTDAGVHAVGQVCSLPLPASPDGQVLDVGQVAYSLNQLLPAQVAIRSCAVVGDEFDVRANIEKTYAYQFSTSPCRNPLTRLHAWHVPRRRGRPAWDEMAAASLMERMQGAHSFSAFGTTPRGKERLVPVDPNCELMQLTLAPSPTGDDPDAWTITVRGDRFLYKMVRNLVGAIVRVGSGELSSDEVLEALASGAFARSASVPLTAPAHGLCLRHVAYEENPFS